MRIRALIPLVAIVAAVLTALFLIPAAQAVEKTEEKVYAEPNEEKALVYFIRTKQPLGGIVSMSLFADDVFLGILAHNCYTYAYLDPGERTLWIDWPGIDKRVELDPGETYYISALPSKDSDEYIHNLGPQKGQLLIESVKFYCSPSDKEIQAAKRKVTEQRPVTAVDSFGLESYMQHGGGEKNIAKWPRVELSGYSILVIEDFKVTDPKAAKRKQMDAMKAAPNRIANVVQKFLAPGTFREVRREELEQPNEAALILRVELTQYKPGSEAVRALVTRWAGASRLDFTARLIDGCNGSVLAIFSDEKAYRGAGAAGVTSGIELLENRLAYELVTYLERQTGAPVAAQPEESAPAPD